MPRKVHPEILVVVDFELAKKFKMNVQNIRKYVVSYFNAVNLRFQSFSTPKIELSIAGLVIAKTKAALPFISQAIIKNTMLDSVKALDAMGRYYYKER